MSAALTNAAAAGFRPERLDRLRAHLEKRVAGGALPGAAWRIERRGVLACRDAVGWADLDRRTKLMPDAIFRIASATKVVTSVAALLLAERRRIGLDDPIDRWLPELADRSVLRNPAGPLDDVVPASRPITPRDLLTHRAGLAGYALEPTTPIAAAILAFNRIMPAVAQDAWITKLGALPLVDQPGSRWRYGYATDVLGLLIERVTGERLENFLHDEIFVPLGMTDSSMLVPADKLDRLVTGYAREDEGGLRVADPALTHPWRGHPGWLSGGGGLVSSIDDYAAFVRMLLRQGQGPTTRLLAAGMVALMTTNVLTEAERAVPFWGDCWATQGFGLGVAIVDKPCALRAPGSIGRFGWPGSYGTLWFVDPAEQMVGVFMAQVERLWMADDLADQINILIYEAIAR